MIEIMCQFDGKIFKPFTIDDQDKAKAFKPNQTVTVKIKGTEKHRSYIQLQRYWVICTKAAAMLSDHVDQFTREDIDFKIKARIIKNHPSFMKRIEVMGSRVIIEPISIAFRNMKHLEACNYFPIAEREIEKMCKCSVEDLLDT